MTRALLNGEPAFSVLPLQPNGKEAPGFTRIPNHSSGLVFTNGIRMETAAWNRMVENGSGVALGDVNQDGWCDVFLCSMEGDNQLFLNQGNWRFLPDEASPQIRMAGRFSTGACLVDLDGDRDLDLLVNSIGDGTKLFLNDGTGRFSMRDETGLSNQFGAHSLALADVDDDGDLDLYVTNYRTTTWQDLPKGETRDIRVVGDRIEVSPAQRFVAIQNPAYGGASIMELGEPDFLYLNHGMGRFEKVDWTQGRFLDENGEALSDSPREWGLSAMFHDFNRDGRPDLYVCNDFYHSRDRLWFNQGNGVFRLASSTVLRSICESSMAVDVADINSDGWDDFMVLDMQSRDHAMRQSRWHNVFKDMVPAKAGNPYFNPEYPRNMVYLNRGDATYAEVGRMTGLDATDWSWNLAFMDVDLDGLMDVLVCNGHHRDMLHRDSLLSLMELRPDADLEQRLDRALKYPPLPQRNLAFQNMGQLKFEPAPAWGFDEFGVSHGMALGDLDNDGDLDLVVNNLNREVSIYRNDTGRDRVAVDLIGKAPNTGAVGARVTLKGRGIQQSRIIRSGGRYLSSDQPRLSFSAVAEFLPAELHIRWPDGSIFQIRDIRPNSLYTVTQLHSRSGSVQITNTVHPVDSANRWFSDATPALSEHMDQGGDRNQKERQAAPPHEASSMGPGLAWYDLNADGREELLVGSHAGGLFSVFQNLMDGGFQLNASSGTVRDQTSVLGWVSENGSTLLLAGFSNYRVLPESGFSVRSFDLKAGHSIDLIEDWGSSIGPLALGDIDGDGDLDLFVGGYIHPGRYPEPAESRLFLNENGRFKQDLKNSTIFEKAGVVTSAVFTDLNGDGFPDLVFSTDWGSVRLFANVQGAFRDITKATGLDLFTGRWQCVATSDFNGDGRMDVVAGNWGRNNRYYSMGDASMEMLSGDLNRDGYWDHVPVFIERSTGKKVPWDSMEKLSGMVPEIQSRFVSARQFAEAGIEEILGDAMDRMHAYSVNTLDSMVFLSSPSGFTPVSLPLEAQMAPAFGLAVADFNGDGFEDVFMAQNCMEEDSGLSRQDAGLGLVLRGSGDGQLQPVSSLESGIRMWGEQRAAAVSDYDQDGKPDLAVSQFQGKTHLWRNEGVNRGVRVRLKGTLQNPHAVGAQAALIFKSGKKGLVREIKSGSGHLSQDSPTLVLPVVGELEAVWVRWPRGKETVTQLPLDTREAVISGTGDLIQVR